MRPKVPFDGPTLHITLNEAQFQVAGRFFFTLSTGIDEHRTEVCSDETRMPTFAQNRIYSLPLGSDPEQAVLTIAATQLLFSRGAKEVGSSRLNVHELLNNAAGVQECTIELLSGGSGAGKTAVATLKFSWIFDDPAAERAAAEAAREEAAAAERAKIEREEEERRISQQHAEERARLEAEERVAAAAAQAAAEEQSRLAALAEAESQARIAAGLAAEQRARRAAAEQEAMISSKWALVLASRVVLSRDDGLRVELTGRQVVGLCDAAARSPSGLVAFMQGGRRVTLSGVVLSALRERVEAKMGEPSDPMATDVTVCLPSTLRAVTAERTPHRVTPLEVSSPRHASTAPANRAARPLSAQWRRATALVGRQGSRVAPAELTTEVDLH